MNENNNNPNVKNIPSKKKSIFNTIFGIIFMIWFIVSLFIPFYLFNISNYYGLIAVGQYFFVLGLIIILTNKEPIGLVGILIGAPLIIFPILMLNFSNSSFSIDWIPIIVLTISIIITIIGLGIIIVPILKDKKLQANKTLEIQATVVDFNKETDGEITFLCPIYEYTFNKQIYKVTTNCFSNNNIPPLNSITYLKIDPNNPQDFYIKNPLLFVERFIGIMFIILGILVSLFIIFFVL